jgi:hypothetical protein
MDPDETMPEQHSCYVCEKELSGYCMRDTPNAKAARKQVTLGDRHRNCKPSEDAGETKRVMLSGRVGAA